jgi:hypothetical protein
MEKTDEKNMSNSRIRMSLLLIGIVSLLILANIQSVVGKKHRMLPADEAISYKFKYLIGANRLEEFKLLQSLIKPTSAVFTVSNSNANMLQGNFASNESDIIFLLGQPDVRISNTKYLYNLSEDDLKCRVIIEFNSNFQVVSSLIKNCN